MNRGHLRGSRGKIETGCQSVFVTGFQVKKNVVLVLP